MSDQLAGRTELTRSKTLTVENLTVSYSKGTKAVDDISFSIAEGEIVALLGPSGCGKTSTLRCIAGLEEPVGGTITIGGDVVVSPSVFKTPQQRDINMVFQSYAVWPHMTVFGNVAYGLKARGFAKGEIRDRVNTVLETVRLEDYAKRYPWQLSGGQQQRVALARAIVTEPKLILFDEPLSNLDAGLRVRMRDELAELQRKIGKTAVYVTHDQEEAMAIADRIILMNGGRIEQESAPEELYRLPATAFAAQFLGRSNLLPGTVTAIVSDDLATVSLPGGLAATATMRGEKSAVGQKVSVAIRPEAVKLLASPASVASPAENQWRGTLVRSAFLGGRYEMSIAVGKDMMLQAEASDAHEGRLGDDVVVSVAPQRALILAR